MRQTLTKPNIKRALAVVMAVVLMLALCVPCVAAETSGNCGSGVTWSYADGTLIISGSGAMESYAARQPAPWDAFREELRIVRIESGVTAIGNYAFSGYPTLASVTLADSVTTVGDYAFADCTALKTVRLGSGIRVVGESAFDSCTCLQSIRLPNGVTTLGRKAFYRCDSLRSVTVPSSVISMGSMVFARCNGLVSADVQANIESLPLWSFYSCDVMTNLTLSASIRSLGSKAVYLCNSLTQVHYLGNTVDGVTILAQIKASLPDFLDHFFKYSVGTSNTVQSISGYVNEDTIVSQTVYVKDSENAVISTTVTTTTVIEGTEEAPVLGNQQTSVKIDAVIDNTEGWTELIEQIEESSQNTPITAPKVQVDVSVSDNELLQGETLASLAGKDVNMTVELTDGSAYRIDCKRISEKALEQEYQLTYTLKSNHNPTEKQKNVFGGAKSYFLNFSADSTLEYSPRIYLGNLNARECAVLYQQLNGVIERVQSAIIGNDGYATFYLGQTLSSVQYFIAIGVEDETYAKAIIPDELSVNTGATEIYEPIEYVVTGERIFMGMNFGQFSYVMFGVIFGLFAVIGTVMAIFYRKKRLEMMYKMKMEGMK